MRTIIIIAEEDSLTGRERSKSELWVEDEDSGLEEGTIQRVSQMMTMITTNRKSSILIITTTQVIHSKTPSSLSLGC